MNLLVSQTQKIDLRKWFVAYTLLPCRCKEKMNIPTYFSRQGALNSMDNDLRMSTGYLTSAQGQSQDQLLGLVGNVVYQPMRLDEANTRTVIFGLYRYLMENY